MKEELTDVGSFSFWIPRTAPDDRGRDRNVTWTKTRGEKLGLNGLDEDADQLNGCLTSARVRYKDAGSVVFRGLGL